jgi:hypothetical protein
VQEEEILTQQSAAALNTEEGGAVEEQLLDYDEDPLVAEKLAMVELEKKVELRANKLVKESAIIIQNEKRVSEEKTGDSSESTSQEEEIDWDGVQVALDSNKEIDPKTFTRKKCGEANLRRSARIQMITVRSLTKRRRLKRSRMKYQVLSHLSLFLIQLVLLLLKI